MPSSARSKGEHSAHSRRNPMPLLVRSLKAFINSSTTSTLKEQRNPTLGQVQKIAQISHDTSPKRHSYPQVPPKTPKSTEKACFRNPSGARKQALSHASVNAGTSAGSPDATSGSPAACAHQD